MAKLKADNQPLEIEKKEEKPIYIDNQRMINQYREYLTKLSSYGEKLKKYKKMLERDEDKLRNQMNFDGIDIDLFETYIRSRKKKENGEFL